MQIKNVSRFPNMISDFNGWTAVGGLITYYQQYAANKVSKEVIYLLSSNGSKDVLAKFTKNLVLDPTKNYTLSFFARSDKGVVDKDSVITILYDNDTQKDIVLAKFSGLYHSMIPFIYNFSGVSKINNLRIKVDTDSTVYLRSISLQTGSLDSRLMITPNDKVYLKQKLTTVTKIGNIYPKDNQLTTYYNNMTNLYGVLCGNMTTYSSNAYPYRYAFTADNAPVLKDNKPQNLYLGFGFGQIQDSTKYNLSIGNIDLLVGDSNSTDNSYNTYRNNNSIINDDCDLNNYADIQNRVNATISSSYNYFTRMNSIQWNGGGGYEVISIGQPFPSSTKATYKFNFVLDDDMVFMYSGNSIPVFITYGYYKDISINVDSIFGFIDKNTETCGDLIDLDMLYTELMLLLNPYQNIANITNNINLYNEENKRYGNISTALNSYSSYGLTVPSYSTTVSKYNNIFNSSIYLLSNGYLDDSGNGNATSVDIYTDYIGVVSGNSYVINCPQKVEGKTRILYYDLNKHLLRVESDVSNKKYFNANPQSGEYFIRFSTFVGDNTLGKYPIVNVTLLSDGSLCYTSIPNAMAIDNAGSAIKSIQAENNTIKSRITMLDLMIADKSNSFTYTFNVTESSGNMLVYKYTNNSTDNLNEIGKVLNNLSYTIDLNVTQSAQEFDESKQLATYYVDGNKVK